MDTIFSRQDPSLRDISNDFWLHMRQSIPRVWVPYNPSDPDNPDTDYARAKSWIEHRLAEWRVLIPNSYDFTMDHPAVQQFLALLRTVPARFCFSMDTDLRNKNQLTKDLVNGWFQMWNDLLAGHGADSQCTYNLHDRGSSDKQERLRVTIERAIIFNWPSGSKEQRSLAILEQHYTRLPAFTQLRIHALGNAFGVIDSRPIADSSGNRVIGGWCYARVLYASPEGPTYEFMVRYKPEANLQSEWGSGFQVYATETDTQGWLPTQVPGRPSQDPVADLYNIIAGPPGSIPNDPATGEPFV
jgi:hypothetical protein